MYISSFIIFCHFPTYFSYYSDPSTTSKGTSYIAVANRVFYNSNARYFFKNTLPFAIKESFYFISGFFGLYKFSRLNIILNDEKYHATNRKKYRAVFGQIGLGLFAAHTAIISPRYTCKTKLQALYFLKIFAKNLYLPFAARFTSEKRTILLYTY